MARESPLDARVPRLSGAVNFRDLGGYATDDGRTVRWKRLYRSGTTHEMTSEDLQQLASRGIRCVYDLRSNSERLQYPNRLAGVTEIDYRYRDHDRLPGDLGRLMNRSDARAEHSRAVMLALYRELPYDFRDTYAELFAQLAQGHLPLVFNCTAGKDRTGVAAALILTALGVPRAVIYQDYLLTERFYERSYALMLKDRRNVFFHGIDARLWEPMMRADSAYLDAMFEQLTTAHGSLEAYLRDELQVDAAMIESLHAHLLEAAQA